MCTKTWPEIRAALVLHNFNDMIVRYDLLLNFKVKIQNYRSIYLKFIFKLLA
jgi:hypothetical protein